MKRSSAAAGSVLFFIVAPCIVAGYLPWLAARTGVAPFAAPAIVRLVAIVFVAAGVSVLVHAFARFVSEGRGTPAPVAPTERLVVGGLYGHVRNPMYVAVLVIIAASGIIYGEGAVFAYGAVAGACMAAFVRYHEEPVLARRFGQSYETYRRAVPGWLPRPTPWQGPQ